MLNKNSKVATAAAAITGIVSAYGFARDMKEKIDDKRFYTASVGESAFIFPSLMEWVDSKVRSRSVYFNSRHNGVSRMYDGEGKTPININGYSFRVEIKKPESDASQVTAAGGAPSMKKLVFTTTQSAGIEALHSFLNEMTEVEKRRERTVTVGTPTSFSDWDRTVLAYRDINSVFLPEGVKESLISDIDNFIDSEARYSTIGAPWHRGYLLYGPPGNGKSTLAAALAHKYGFSLHSMPLSSVKDDSQLGELVSCIEPNSILLLEDIDIFSKSMEREQSDTGPTLAGILNALDGVSTPHGLITFMTTNHKEQLDPALIRPGRIDYTLELKAPNTHQITKMFEYVYGEELGVGHKELDSMAELTNIFKRNINSADGARLEIKDS